MTVELIHGDCLEVMCGMGDKSVDVVITDPPYGVNYRNNEWDKEIPEWLDIARNKSSVLVFTTAIITLWNYPQPDWVGCWKIKAGASRSRLGGFNHWCPIMFYGKPKFIVDTFETSLGKTIHENKGIDHPSPKPLNLMKWIIENSSNEGDTILDPFMGSGTTGVACVQLNRNFIGIEIDKGYFDIASKRIAVAQMQPSLLEVVT